MNNRDTEAAVDSLDEWVADVAESRNVPKEEVLDRMLSSYWILAELTGMVTDGQDPGRRRGEGRTPEPPRSVEEGAAYQDSDNPIQRSMERGNVPRSPAAEPPAGEESSDGSPAADVGELLALLADLRDGGEPSSGGDDLPESGRVTADLRRLLGADAAQTGSETTPRGEGEQKEDLQARIDRIEALLAREAAQRRERREREQEQRLAALTDRLDSLEDAVADGADDELAEEVQAEVAEIRALVADLEVQVEDRASAERVDGLEAAVEDAKAAVEQRATDERVDDLEATIELLATDERVDDLEAAIEAVVADIEGRIEVLATDERVDDLEAAVADVATAEWVEELEARVEQRATDQRADELAARIAELVERVDGVEAAVGEHVDRVAGDLDALERRVEGDAEHVEEILTYVLESLDDLEETTGSLRQSSGDVQAVLDDYAERQRLDDLRRDANQLGVRSATCDACDSDVDVGLLTEPSCPQCGRQFERVTSRRWLWRTKGVLHTGTGEPDAGPLPSSPNVDSRSIERPNQERSAPRNDRATDSTSKFEWLDG